MTNLVTAIANGVVHLVTARFHFRLDVVWHSGSLDSRDKAMLWMVAMNILGEAWLAEVIVLASCAMDEMTLGEFCKAVISDGPERPTG